MIYSVYWAYLFEDYNQPAVQRNYVEAAKVNPQYQPYADLAWLDAPMKVNRKQLLAEAIKETDNNSFVFIILNEQMVDFNNWLDKYSLKENEVYRMAQPITNGKYEGRRLNLIVLMSKKHAMHDMFKLEETENAEA